MFQNEKRFNSLVLKNKWQQFSNSANLFLIFENQFLLMYLNLIIFVNGMFLSYSSLNRKVIRVYYVVLNNYYKFVSGYLYTFSR